MIVRTIYVLGATRSVAKVSILRNIEIWSFGSCCGNVCHNKAKSERRNGCNIELFTQQKNCKNFRNRDLFDSTGQVAEIAISIAMKWNSITKNEFLNSAREYASLEAMYSQSTPGTRKNQHRVSSIIWFDPINHLICSKDEPSTYVKWLAFLPKQNMLRKSIISTQFLIGAMYNHS